MTSLALLGAGALLAWLSLPLLSLAARSGPEASPASRFRALLLAYLLATSLFALPFIRSALSQRSPASPVEVEVLPTAAQATLRAAVGMAIPPLALVGGIWLLLSFFGLARFAARTAHVALLAREGAEIPAPVRALSEQLARELGIAPPQLVFSLRATLPFVRAAPPTVVVPSMLLEALDEPGLALVLRHELVHLSRLDHLSALLLELLAIPFTFHPTARDLSRRIGLAREMAVDRRVGAVAPRAYAHLLVDVAELHRFGPREAGEVALETSSLERRVEMLTRPDSHRPARFWPLVALTLALGGLAALVPSSSAAQMPEEQGAEHGAKLVLEVNQSLVIATEKLERIAIGDPTIADVKPRSRNQIEITGLSEGRTTMLVWTADGKKTTYLLDVK
jgi:beta-lactamase regulating signal transducer with metallopeptidase domain